VGLPDDESQIRVNLALQVAQVAAQVSAALHGQDPDARVELAARLEMAEERLEQQGAPAGLIPFLAVMRGLLSGEDVSELAAELPASYRAVYAQLINETQPAGDSGASGSMTVRQVLDEVARNVILAMSGGTLTQRLRMADTLQAMQREAAERPDLSGLCDLLQAARILLQGDDPGLVADELRGPFLAKWEEILAAVGGVADE